MDRADSAIGDRRPRPPPAMAGRRRPRLRAVRAAHARRARAGRTAALQSALLTPFDVVERIERRSRLTRMSAPAVAARLPRAHCRRHAARRAHGPRARRAIDLLPASARAGARDRPRPRLARAAGRRCRAGQDDPGGTDRRRSCGRAAPPTASSSSRRPACAISGPTSCPRDSASTRPFSTSRAVRRSIATLPVGVNPWQTMPVAIASIDYVKRPEVLPAVRRLPLGRRRRRRSARRRRRQRSSRGRRGARRARALRRAADGHAAQRRSPRVRVACAASARSHGDTLLVVPPHPPGRARSAPTRRIHRLHVRLEPRRSAHARAAGAIFRGRSASSTSARTRATTTGSPLSVLHKRALSSARSLQHSVDRRLATLAPRGRTREPARAAARRSRGRARRQATKRRPGRRCSPRAMQVTSATCSARWPTPPPGRPRHETKIAALARLLRRVRRTGDRLHRVPRHAAARAATSLAAAVRDASRRPDPRRTARGRSAQFTQRRQPPSARDRRRRRRTQSPADVPARHQSRAAVESDAARAAHRPRRSHRPAPDGPRVSPDRARQRRVAGAVAGFRRVSRGAGGHRRGGSARVHRAPARSTGIAIRRAGSRQVGSRPQRRSGRLARTRGARPKPAASPGRGMLVTAGDRPGARAAREPRTVLSAGARHWQTRAALGGRALMLWRIVAEDGSGRAVASTLVAVTVDVRGGIRRRSDC